MLSLSLLLITLEVLSVRAQLTSEVIGIPANEWQCGADPGHSQHIVKEIHDKCPVVAGDFNHCCAIHSDCYSNLKHLETCNKMFCDCINAVAKKSSPQCSKVATDTCNAVEIAGRQFYPTYPKSSLPHRPLPAPLRNTPGISKVSEQYKVLYERCPYQSGTLSSCATYFKICPRQDAQCVLKLVKCLDDTKLDREKDKKCDEAVISVINQLINLKEDRKKATPQPIVQELTVTKEIQKRRYLHNVALHSPVADSQLFIFLISVAMVLLLCVAACFSYRAAEKLVAVEVPDGSV